jgi:HEAT repeat protein
MRANEEELYYDGKSVSGLVLDLQAKDRHVRLVAARALCRKGAEATIALPALLALSQDSDPLVRVQAIRATLHLPVEPSQAVPMLRKMLNDENEMVRSYATDALKVCGQGAEMNSAL